MRRLFIILLLASPAFAKSLHWRSIDVTARLDRDGNLRVVERQQMVFDGDWNGGERNFNLRPGQRIELHKLSRIEDGREIPLVHGDLSAVDHYDFTSADVLRWRSRLPGDPPFENREITYVLDYTYSNILDQTYHFSHDFGLPERSGSVERFLLILGFDEVWNTPQVIERRENLAPLQGVIVARELRYTGDGRPAGVRRTTPRWVGLLVLLLFAGGAVMLIRAFLREEREIGRLEPLSQRFDEAVLALKAELAGAVWDAGIGAPEVAATLARMAQEGKITTRVDGETMHLHLNVAREQLGGYELELVQRLFIHGSDDTDTDRVKARYTGVGFDPSTVIRPGIEAELAAVIPGWSVKTRRFRAWTRVLALFGALLLLIVAVMVSESPGMSIASIVTGFLFGGIAAIVAHFKSRAVTDVKAALIASLIALVFPSLWFLAAALSAHKTNIGVTALVAMALWLLAWLRLVLDLLKIRDSREVIAYRQRVAGTRQFFVQELGKPDPALRDEWFPYVLAFGLGPQVDQWFRAFGARVTAPTHASSWSSSSSSSSPSSSSSWTGGGGAFGGAGATGSWAIAAGAMAAGVAAPSSSGSGGGGGGGGSSSGGGGGGGW